MYTPEAPPPPKVPHRPSFLAGLGAGFGAFAALIAVGLLASPHAAATCGGLLMPLTLITTLVFLREGRYRLAAGVVLGAALGVALLVAALREMSAADGQRRFRGARVGALGGRSVSGARRGMHLSA